MSATSEIDVAQVCAILRRHCPEAEAVYLFGSYAAGAAWPNSDVDLGLLLPPVNARQAGCLAISAAVAELALALGAEVDLINLREVPTLLQSEIIHQGQPLAIWDRRAVDVFEMQVLKAYQNLCQERAGIVAAGLETGRFYQ